MADLAGVGPAANETGGPQIGLASRTLDVAGPLGALAMVSAIGLSAFLLFAVELLAGRLILPVFGGSAGVWTTALVLFTGLLFCGYLYAHYVATRLSVRTGTALHAALALAALLAVLAAPADLSTLRVPALPEALNVLLALLVICGAVIFLLGTTTPLLSAWFARWRGSPWWLYALSNAMSLAALLAYPLVIEPNLPLSLQRWLMVGGLVLFGSLIALIALSARRTASPPQAVRSTATSGYTERPALRRQLRWLFAAFVPAGLLSATTNLIATDLISAPLVWIGPLGLYLLSFVVAFSERGRRVLPLVQVMLPAAAMLLLVPLLVPTALPVIVLVPIVLLAYAVLAIAIHGGLALDRPAPEHLTRFYVVIAGGGALATAFVALLAPLVFPGVYEYPLLIVAALVVLAIMARSRARHVEAALEAGEMSADRRPGSGLAGAARASVVRLVPYVAAALIVFGSIEAGQLRWAMGWLLAIGAVIIALAWRPKLLAPVMAIAITVMLVGLTPPAEVRLRNFYGVLSVREVGATWQLVSGTTMHGLQFRDERAAEPAAYYVRAGPVGEVFTDLRQRTNNAAIGVVGLGIGTISAYAQAGDRLAFYEIDPGVVELARDERFFTHLRDSASPAEIIMGDARLSLRSATAGSFDVLFLDAFSSDSIPVHLLTREAMAEYMATLRPGGVLIFHVSNRYYELAPAVAATARTAGLEARLRDYVPSVEERERLGAVNSVWVAVGRAEDVERFARAGWTTVGSGPALSDDFADVLRTLRVRADGGDPADD